MVSVNFKLAFLNALAKWPDRRATVDEIRREVGIIFANGDQAEPLKRLSALGDIDIFQTGLVSRNEEGFQITNAGLSLLRWLESSVGPSPEISTASTLQPFKLIDDLIGTEERLKIFDLEFRTLVNVAFDENGSDQPGQDARNQVVEAPQSAPSIGGGGPPESVNSKADESDGIGQPARPVEANWLSEIEALGGTSLMDANGLAESVDSQADESDGTGQPTHPDEANWLSEIEAPGDTSLMDADGLAESVDSEADSESVGAGQPALHDDGQPVSNDWSPAGLADAPAFLRQGLVSNGQGSRRGSLQWFRLFAFIAEKTQLSADAWRAGDGIARWKPNLTLSSGWKRSVGRLSGPYFRYLWFGLVSAAVVVAAFVSMPHRPQKPEKPEQAMAVAVTPPPPAQSFNALPPGKQTLFDPNPSRTLRRSEPDEIPVPETPDAPVQLDVRRVLKLMNAGVTKYASEQDEAKKVKGARLIQIAALLGNETARNLIVLNYPRGAGIRAAVTAPDVILYAIDQLLAKGPEAATEFVALANYFAARGEIPRFAKIVVDVVRDDPRLSDAEQVGNLFKALSPVRGVCSAIKQVVLNDPTIGENDCSDTVQAGLLAQAKRSNSLEKGAQERGIELMRRIDAAP